MSTYQDRPLIDYLPNVLKDVREYQSLTVAEQSDIFKLFEEIQFVLKNEFVVTSTEYGIMRWEKNLGIVPIPAAETLEFRRNRILLRLQSLLPFTERWLKQKLDELFTADNVTFSVDYNNYKLSTIIKLADMNLFDEVKILFKNFIPANMLWAFEVLAALFESIIYAGLTTRTVTQTVFNLI